MSRVAHLHLPGFPLQRFALEQPGLWGRPLVAVEEVSGMRRVAFASKEAARGGVRPGMTATAASALVPELLKLELHPELDLQALLALGEALLSLSPRFQLDPPDGLWLDLSGAHLWGGEGGLLEAALQKLEAAGYVARGTVATGLRVARLLSRHGQVRILCVPPGEQREALAALPISALETDDFTERCRRLGLTRLGQLAELSAPSLVARFGVRGLELHRLARGEDELLLNPTAPSERLLAALQLEWAAESMEPVLFSIKALLDRLCGQLQGRRRAAVRVTVTLKLESGGEHPVRARLARPTSQVRLLLELFRLQLEGVALSQPVCGISAEVEEWCDAPASQPGLPELDPEAPQGDASLEVVLTRLATTLGEGALGALELPESYRPESASRLIPFRAPSSRVAPWKPSFAQERPVRLLQSPMPVDVRLGPLRQLLAVRLDGRTCRTLAVAGPEKLRGDWWSKAPYGRDYYRVVCEGVGALWVFEDLRARKFYLHGYFD